MKRGDVAVLSEVVDDLEVGVVDVLRGDEGALPVAGEDGQNFPVDGLECVVICVSWRDS